MEHKWRPNCSRWHDHDKAAPLDTELYDNNNDMDSADDFWDSEVDLSNGHLVKAFDWETVALYGPVTHRERKSRRAFESRMLDPSWTKRVERNRKAAWRRKNPEGDKAARRREYQRRKLRRRGPEGDAIREHDRLRKRQKAKLRA